MAFARADRFFKVKDCSPPPGAYNPIFPGDDKLIKQILSPRKDKYKELVTIKRAKNRLDVLATPRKY